MVCAISQPALLRLRRRPESKNAYADVFSVTFGLRSYNPRLGRWINRDPIGEQGGVNLMGFVGNSPSDLTDLFGLSIKKWIGDSWRKVREVQARSNLRQLTAAMQSGAYAIEDAARWDFLEEVKRQMGSVQSRLETTLKNACPAKKYCAHDNVVKGREITPDLCRKEAGILAKVVAHSLSELLVEEYDTSFYNIVPKRGSPVFWNFVDDRARRPAEILRLPEKLVPNAPGIQCFQYAEALEEDLYDSIYGGMRTRDSRGAFGLIRVFNEEYKANILHNYVLLTLPNSSVKIDPWFDLGWTLDFGNSKENDIRQLGSDDTDYGRPYFPE